MSAVTGDPRSAGRDAFSAGRWERAYELLSALDVAQPLPPDELELLSEASCWTRRYDEMLDLLERRSKG